MMVEILESEVWLFCDYFVKEPDALCLCFFCHLLSSHQK